MLKRAFSSRTCLSALSAACRRARWTISEEAIVGHRTATVPALSNFLMISGATCTKRHHFMNNWTCSKKPVFRVNVVHAVFWGFTPNKGGSRMFHAVSRTPLAQLHMLRPFTFYTTRHCSGHFFGYLYQPILIAHSSACTCAHRVRTICKPGVTNQIPMVLKSVVLPNIPVVHTIVTISLVQI